MNEREGLGRLSVETSAGDVARSLITLMENGLVREHMNFLEQMVSEWLEYQGYSVRRNVLVGRRPGRSHTIGLLR